MQTTIHNEFLTLTVDTHGAEAVSLKNAAGGGAALAGRPGCLEAPCAHPLPWTGKLPGGTFTHGGKTYKGGQHGFARDVEHTLLRAEGDTIELELRSDAATKAQRFPFDFVLTSTFRLEGRTVHHTPDRGKPRRRPGGAAVRHRLPPGLQHPLRQRPHHHRLRVPLRWPLKAP